MGKLLPPDCTFYLDVGKASHGPMKTEDYMRQENFELFSELCRNCYHFLWKLAKIVLKTLLNTLNENIKPHAPLYSRSLFTLEAGF